MKALSDSASLSQDNDHYVSTSEYQEEFQKNDQEKDQETFQVSYMDYYSGEDPDDWDSFIKENFKTSQNHPEKAKYSEINDTIVMDEMKLILKENEELINLPNCVSTNPGVSLFECKGCHKSIQPSEYPSHLKSCKVFCKFIKKNLKI